MARESALRQRVGALLRAHGFFVQPIESDTAPGIPDLYYLKQGTGGWVELKSVKVIPKKVSTSLFKSLNHPLSNEQANWLSLNYQNGGRGWVLAGYERTLWLVPGHIAYEQFNDFTVTQLDKFKVTREELVEQLLFGQ
jgi:hypothetical protein